ncbi:MAG: prolyl-tRNA synthetase associated domain-containing protein [Kiloniellales bacterium]|nr:prolyl-tRNA synthetase associated domain-containing protein [Kiloniellales bacterium]
MSETRNDSAAGGSGSEGRLADGSAPAGARDLLARLEALGIAAESFEHPAVYTVEEAKALRGELAGAHIKNLFLRNKKGAMWLVTCQEDRQIDLKALGERLGAGRLSFGSAERLMKYLGVLPGAVTPFGVVNDRQGQVAVVLDSALADQDRVNCHPLVNTMTTALSGRDLVRFLEAAGHPPRLLDFDTD